MHFASVDDFLIDYMYLLAEQTAGNNQKMYNVQGKTTFDEFMKGLFQIGGALFDYAAAGYASYYSLANDVRSGINSNNDNILDKIVHSYFNLQMLQMVLMVIMTLLMVMPLVTSLEVIGMELQEHGNHM